MNALINIAPVLSSIEQVQSFANAPLAFTNGLTGTAFYDQKNRLVLTITNPGGGAVTGFAKLRGLMDGTYKIVDLFTNQALPLTVISGIATIPVNVTRWDTRAFAITFLAA